MKTAFRVSTFAWAGMVLGSLAAALANIREAIVLCLEVRRQDHSGPVIETPELIAREIRECLEDRAAEGLPLTIETQEVDVEVEVAA